ncbi:MAG TPA: hypothetical protein VHL53_05410 [Acidimicrobiia bacterium]|nr:hypothetical protein [Acidimicrobiia bacterium]
MRRAMFSRCLEVDGPDGRHQAGQRLLVEGPGGRLPHPVGDVAVGEDGDGLAPFEGRPSRSL